MFRGRIWQPPPRDTCRAKDSSDVFLKTISGARVHLRLVSATADQNNDVWDKSKGLIVYFHGNAEDLRTCNLFMTWLALNMECNVMGLDYVGYGQSDVGSTTEQNMCEAADAVLEHATSALGYKHHQITVVGRSLGSIPALHLASNVNNAGLQGLVLISALASGARCVIPSAYVPSAVRNTLDSLFANNMKRASSVHCMVILFHGDRDTTVKLENSELLKAKFCGWCHARLVVVRGADHNSIIVGDLPQVHAQLRPFLLDSKENARLHSCHAESLTPYSPPDLLDFT